MIDTLESAKGTYLLLIRLNQRTRLTIGRLGTFDFQTGWYAYAGSALGPGGLQARLARHARTKKRTHWHIDYLLEQARLVQSWQTACPTRLECTWASALLQLPKAQIAIHRFGASDCRCPGHLVYWPTYPEANQIKNVLRAASPDHCDLRHTNYTQ